MYKKNNNRNGVTLLVVLALMVMFAMLVTAFMVFVTLARRNAETSAKALIHPPDSRRGYGLASGLPDESSLDSAFQVLLVGSLDLDTVVGPHSILENLYGHPINGLMRPMLYPVWQDRGLLVVGSGFSMDEVYRENLIGNVVTVQLDDTEHPLHNKSTFIVDVQPGDHRGIHIFLAPFTVSDMFVQQQVIRLNEEQGKPGSRWIYNTPQFSGTGAGYGNYDLYGNPQPGYIAGDPSVSSSAQYFPTLLSRYLDNDGKPAALRPNILAPNSLGNQMYQQYLQNNDVRMNPDYTAPDFMTMFLAWNDVKDNGKLEQIIPSFHRPQLVKYWWKPDYETSNYVINNPTELRKYVLRPLPIDHPDFTGSNLATDWRDVYSGNREQKSKTLFKFLTEGPWDVDNDGDGQLDGIWLDIGLPASQDTTGQWHKPLVSYYVIDMDGRINVNTLSNLTLADNPDSDIDITLYENQNNSNSSLNVKGTGIGPAQLSSELVPEAILTARYGDDGKPGGTGNDLLKNNGINLEAYTKGGLLADWWGFSPILFDEWGNRVMTVPESFDPLADNPYLMNPYNDTSGDKPFNPDDLESLLRSVIDLDNTALPPRFRELLGDIGDIYDSATFASPELRYNLGTRSSDIPVAARYVPAFDKDNFDVTRGYTTLYDYVELLCGHPDRAKELWKLLPEEIRRGEKVNLNRLTLREDWMTGGNDLLTKKVLFAQEIFYLLRVTLPTKTIHHDEATLERLAQWAVNLVDFIDPDDVMTPFIFSKSEFAHSNIFNVEDSLLLDLLLEGTLTAQQLEDEGCALIWGFEKPEVAITETLAIHNRGVASRPNDSTDFRQVIDPQGSLFVEIQRLGNPHRSYQASSLVDADSGNTLNLAKKTSESGGDYVWRIAIGESAKISPGRFIWDNDDRPEKNALRQLLTPSSGKAFYPQFYQRSNGTPDAGHYHPDLEAPERFIWFGSDTPDLLADIEVLRRSYFCSAGADPVLDTDTTFVIAPRLETNFAPGESISLPVERTMIATGPTAETGRTPSSRVAQVNVSEPLPTIFGSALRDGYWGSSEVISTGGNASQPFDGRLPGTIPRQRGTVPCYKTICLQRLADPTRPYNEICNPYITVDWNMIDLQVINSVSRNGLGLNQNQATEEPEGTAGFAREPEFKHFSSRQWKQTVSGFANLWDRTLESTVLTPNTGKAGLEEWEYTINSDGLAEKAPSHTLGESNWEEPQSPFLHFPWHDAPLMSTAELMLVPASAPGRFGIEFHDRGQTSADNFFGLHDLLIQVRQPRTGNTIPENERPRFGYYYDGTANGNDSVYLFNPYLNWEEHKTPEESYMQRLFDFVRVPSRFAGTIQGWTSESDSKPIYSMREPGKINLNTLTSEAWESLRNGRVDFPSYDEFRKDRQWSAVKGDAEYPSEFRPFRSPSATYFVPPRGNMASSTETNRDALFGSSVSATLLGLKKTGEAKPVLIDESQANPYTVLENAMRLSDVTTTRSNVFAIWITVGYFNVEKFDDRTALLEKYSNLTHINSDNMFNAVYPDGFVLGAEKGLDDGTVKRHRAFYLIDRSRPVGFRRGEKLNSEKVVIKKTVLE